MCCDALGSMHDTISFATQVALHVLSEILTKMCGFSCDEWSLGTHVRIFGSSGADVNFVW